MLTGKGCRNIHHIFPPHSLWCTLNRYGRENGSLLSCPRIVHQKQFLRHNLYFFTDVIFPAAKIQSTHQSFTACSVRPLRATFLDATPVQISNQPVPMMLENVGHEKVSEEERAEGMKDGCCQRCWENSLTARRCSNCIRHQRILDTSKIPKIQKTAIGTVAAKAWKLVSVSVSFPFDTVWMIRPLEILKTIQNITSLIKQFQ